MQIVVRNVILTGFIIYLVKVLCPDFEINFNNPSEPESLAEYLFGGLTEIARIALNRLYVGSSEVMVAGGQGNRPNPPPKRRGSQYLRRMEKDKCRQTNQKSNPPPKPKKR